MCQEHCTYISNDVKIDGWEFDLPLRVIAKGLS